MNILSKKNYDLISKKHNRGLILFFAFLLLGIVGYIISFKSGILFVSLVVGVLAVIICSAIYFSAVFEYEKLIKLFKNSKIGINQEERYTFIKFDGETERDGIKLSRITAKYTNENEEYERTLYSVKALPFVELKTLAEYTFTTYQNIIISVKE